MPLALFFLLVAISGLLGLCVLVWCARLVLTGNWKHSLSVLVAGLLAGLLAIGLLMLALLAFGETIASLPEATYATTFGLGFSWGSFAMAVSLGLWPFIKGFVHQSRRWADRR